MSRRADDSVENAPGGPSLEVGQAPEAAASQQGASKVAPPRRDTLQLARATRIAFTVFLLINLVSAGAAIGLLGRMRPAIERIIERNIYSLEAVESMLVVLASPGDGQQVRRADFDAALARAERNITSDRERPLVTQLRERSGPALIGDSSAKREVLSTLKELAQVNREEIEAADQDAKRLGTAGAWAVSFLALLALASGLVGLRRFDRRVLGPVEELAAVLSDHSAGQPLRRCAKAGNASDELHDSMTTLNELLDAHAEARRRGSARGLSERAETHDYEAGLRASLDLIERPTWLVTAQGEVLVANHAALDRVAEERELALEVKSAAMRAATTESKAEQSELAPRLHRVDVPTAPLVVLQLRAATSA